jgi:hypothetical protein
MRAAAAVKLASAEKHIELLFLQFIFHRGSPSHLSNLPYAGNDAVVYSVSGRIWKMN